MAEPYTDRQSGAGTGVALDTVFDVFLSYSNPDKQVVQQLAHELSRSGVKPWLDEWNLIPGTLWQPEIEEVLKKCRTVAVLVGPSGLGRWQMEEMRTAVARRVQDTKRLFRLIPVLLPGANWATTPDAGEFLAATTRVEFTTSIQEKEP